MSKNEQAARRVRNCSTLIFVCLAIAALPAFARPVAKVAANTDKLLYIEGNSDLFANFKARASHSCFHIESRMGGSIWKEQTPNTVTIYNNENKVFYLQPVKDYLTELTQDYLPIPIEEFEPPTKTVFQGRPASKYLGYATIGKMGRQCVAELTCIDNFSLTPAAHQMWCRLLGVNGNPTGLPVLLKQQRASVLGFNAKVVKLGRPVWVRVLTTKKLMELPPAADSFAVKPNWKQAKDKAALLFSKDGSLQAKDLDDFFRSDAK
jgi:hypothetical protein